MKHVDINIKGHVEALKHVIPIMKKQHRGKIILLGSIFGVEGWENASAYAGTKAAMQGLGRSLSYTLKEWNISTTIIAPGMIDTPQLNADALDRGISLDKMKKIYAEEIPLKRLGKASDIAFLIRFLCDGGNDFLNGSIIQSNGGESRTDLNWGSNLL